MFELSPIYLCGKESKWQIATHTITPGQALILGTKVRNQTQPVLIYVTIKKTCILGVSSKARPKLLS